MRLKKTVTLPPAAEGESGQTVTVLELRAQDIRAIVANLPADLDGLDVKTILTERLPEALALLAPCFELPDGIKLDELGVSALDTLATAWWEMHRDFFVRATTRLGGLGALLMHLTTPSLPPSAPGTLEPETTG